MHHLLKGSAAFQPDSASSAVREGMKGAAAVQADL